MTQAEQPQQPQIGEQDKVYLLLLSGGLGARVIQTAFIRSLIKKRKLDKTSYPIVVIDNTLISQMVSAAMSGQNVIGIQAPEVPNTWPQDPGVVTLEDGPEHPMFTEWRQKFQQYAVPQGSLNRLVTNNWKRAFSIEYGFALTKLIHMHKLSNEKSSFIGNHYADVMGLDYDGGIPMLSKSQDTPELTSFIRDLKKPFILSHLGMDKNPQDFMSGLNYRTFKVWSLQRWKELAAKLSDKYEFVQVYAGQYNPEVEGIKSIKVDNLNPVLQLLQSEKCRSFIGIDNYLPHLAAAIPKRGVVLWGSVSPYVWGWKHNINIWNKHSCKDIACWRPGLFDHDSNGKLWICDHYSCMRSITVDQVVQQLDKLEVLLDKDKNKERIRL